MTARSSTTGRIGLRDDALSACVGCGLCLPHCPTYRATGDERRSPRGRIALMRIVDSGLAEPNAEWLAAMDTCIQCRGCEPACPSGVPFGELMAHTQGFNSGTRRLPLRLRLGLRVLGRPQVLRVGTRLLALAQRLGFFRSSGFLPGRLPLRLPRRPTPAEVDVVLFTGCVMDTWTPHVHDAAQRVLEATGARVGRSGIAAGCCGALHVHAGLREEARSLAHRVMAALPGDQQVLADSAGCGAMLKEYGDLLGTEEAHAFSARVADVHEWLVERLDRLTPFGRRSEPVIIQDPCHLRHVQRVDGAMRAVLAPFVPVVELDDEGLCCGAGGAFAVLQPDLAAKVRDQKVAAIDRAVARSGAAVVVSANPGCSFYLGAAGYQVRHPLEVVAERLAESASQEITDGN